MRVAHRLVGYDRHTNKVKIQLEVPDRLLGAAKKIAGVPYDDPQAAGSYPLSINQTARVADLIGADIGAEDAEFFLEAFASA